jgi:hypothetical protein
MEFKEGDRVVVIDYPEEGVIGSQGIVQEYNGVYWRVLLDISQDSYGDLFETCEIELIHKEEPYDPTQQGDTEDDI